MKSAVIIILILVVVVLGFIFFGGGEETTTEPSPIASEPAPLETEPEGTVVPRPQNVVTVTYQNNAFSPGTVSIGVGDTVIFENKHSAPVRISSNPHPIHTSHPDLESGSVPPSQTYEITFDEAVTVNYHNHFNPGATGRIIVE